MATVPPSRLHELKVSVPPGCSENCRRAGQGVSGHGEPGPRRVSHPGVALVPSPPTRLTCGRVARERAAPGAARSPELPALSQLFLLVLPPPALSHGRGATAQPGDGGRAAGSGCPSPARSLGGEGRFHLQRAELGRGPGRAPRLLGTHRRPAAPLLALSARFPSWPLLRPTEVQPGIRAGSRPASPPRGGVTGCRGRPPAAQAGNTPRTQTDVHKINKGDGGERERRGGLASSCPFTISRSQQETHSLDT